MKYELRHAQVIERFGAGRLARCLNLSRSTVYSWRDAGVIPAKHHPDVLAAAKVAGIDLEASDFIGPADDSAVGDYEVVHHV